MDEQQLQQLQEFFQQLPPELQQKISALPQEKQIEVLIGLMQRAQQAQGQEQPMGQSGYSEGQQFQEGGEPEEEESQGGIPIELESNESITTKTGEKPHPDRGSLKKTSSNPITGEETYESEGPSHESGGMKVLLSEGDIIYSDKLKIPYDFKVGNKNFKGKSFKEASDYLAKKEKEIQEKYEENVESGQADELTQGSVALMLAKFSALRKQLNDMQEAVLALKDYKTKKDEDEILSSRYGTIVKSYEKAQYGLNVEVDKYLSNKVKTLNGIIKAEKGLDYATAAKLNFLEKNKNSSVENISRGYSAAFPENQSNTTVDSFYDPGTNAPITASSPKVSDNLVENFFNVLTRGEIGGGKDNKNNYSKIVWNTKSGTVGPYGIVWYYHKNTAKKFGVNSPEELAKRPDVQDKIAYDLLNQNLKTAVEWKNKYNFPYSIWELVGGMWLEGPGSWDEKKKEGNGLLGKLLSDQLNTPTVATQRNGQPFVNRTPIKQMQMFSGFPDKMPDEFKYGGNIKRYGGDTGCKECGGMIKAESGFMSKIGSMFGGGSGSTTGGDSGGGMMEEPAQKSISGVASAIGELGNIKQVQAWNPNDYRAYKNEQLDPRYQMSAQSVQQFDPTIYTQPQRLNPNDPMNYAQEGINIHMPKYDPNSNMIKGYLYGSKDRYGFGTELNTPVGNITYERGSEKFSDQFNNGNFQRNKLAYEKYITDKLQLGGYGGISKSEENFNYPDFKGQYKNINPSIGITAKYNFENGGFIKAQDGVVDLSKFKKSQSYPFLNENLDWERDGQSTLSGNNPLYQSADFYNNELDKLEKVAIPYVSKFTDDPGLQQKWVDMIYGQGIDPRIYILEEAKVITPEKAREYKDQLTSLTAGPNNWTKITDWKNNEFETIWNNYQPNFDKLEPYNKYMLTDAARQYYLRGISDPNDEYSPYNISYKYRPSLTSFDQVSEWKSPNSSSTPSSNSTPLTGYGGVDPKQWEELGYDTKWKAYVDFLRNNSTHPLSEKYVPEAIKEASKYRKNKDWYTNAIDRVTGPVHKALWPGFDEWQKLNPSQSTQSDLPKDSPNVVNESRNGQARGGIKKDRYTEPGTESLDFEGLKAPENTFADKLRYGVREAVPYLNALASFFEKPIYPTLQQKRYDNPYDNMRTDIDINPTMNEIDRTTLTALNDQRGNPSVRSARMSQVYANAQVAKNQALAQKYNAETQAQNQKSQGQSQYRNQYDDVNRQLRDQYQIRFLQTLENQRQQKAAALAYMSNVGLRNKEAQQAIELALSQGPMSYDKVSGKIYTDPEKWKTWYPMQKYILENQQESIEDMKKQIEKLKREKRSVEDDLQYGKFGKIVKKSRYI